MQRVASVSVPFKGPASGRLFGFTGLGLMATGAGILSLVLSTGTSLATVVDDRLPLAPLSSVAAPAPSGGTIANQAAAVQLGKALFWDVQVGGDGKQACASCHFVAGEDTRLTNTVNPGNDGIFNSEGINGPGQTILAVRNITNDDRLGSAGEVGANPSQNAAAKSTPIRAMRRTFAM